MITSGQITTPEKSRAFARQLRYARPPLLRLAAAALVVVGGLSGCSSLGSSPGGRGAFTQVGLASWYGPGFQHRRTASGERFEMRAMTAAHRTLPFNTIVRVTNLENGRRVTVRINDRGPNVRGRIIDLSARAARELGIAENGVVKVKLEAFPAGQPTS